jgi:hypothetical protein
LPEIIGDSPTLKSTPRVAHRGCAVFKIHANSTAESRFFEIPQNLNDFPPQPLYHQSLAEIYFHSFTEIGSRQEQTGSGTRSDAGGGRACL